MKKTLRSLSLLLVLISAFSNGFAASNKKTSDEDGSKTTALTATSSAENLVQQAISNPDYMVTPGDIYSLNFAAGSTAVSYKIVVDSTYRIRVANLAILDANGKSYISLKKQVEEIVSKNYPMSGVQFILTVPSAFKVTVTGFVDKTTTVNAWALTRLSEIIENAPLTVYSSRRFVSVKSVSGKSVKYDLFKSRRNTDFTQDPYVRPGDIITIQKNEKNVSISGSVIFPGTYELDLTENLQDLVNIQGGGLAPLADLSRIELTRQISSSVNYGEKQYLKEEDFKNNFELKNLDSVFIESFSNLKPRIYLEGAVTSSVDSKEDLLNTSSKRYATFEKGASYDFFVRSHENWFSPEADLAASYIIRDGKTISLDIKKILNDSSYYSTLLIEENDTLRIPFKQYFVSVAGSVNKPGRYPYIPDRTYEYYIGLAGGFNKTQNAFNSVKIVNVNGKKLKKNAEITPESTITASSNSFWYYFGQISPVLTTACSIITTGISIYSITR